MKISKSNAGSLAENVFFNEKSAANLYAGSALRLNTRIRNLRRRWSEISEYGT
jgi:hypothetical protein